MSDHDLQAHDVTIRQQPQFTPGGTVAVHTLVTFYVGNHGPFTLDYAPGHYSPEAVTTDIGKRVRELQTITTTRY